MYPPKGIHKNGHKSPELEVTQTPVNRRMDHKSRDIRTMDYDPAIKVTKSQPHMTTRANVSHTHTSEQKALDVKELTFK